MIRWHLMFMVAAGRHWCLEASQTAERLGDWSEQGV